MTGAKIYLEGGGEGKSTRVDCEEGFSKLFKACGYSGRMPRIVACGSRKDAYDSFKAAQAGAGGAYLALLVDSEDDVTDIEKPWEHLRKRDGKEWEKPANATDKQVFLMTNCMETWIVADREALRLHYHGKFQENSLPPLIDLEKRHRHDVQDKLAKATSECNNGYEKGKRSFEPLHKLRRNILEPLLPSFARMCRILDATLKKPERR